MPEKKLSSPPTAISSRFWSFPGRSFRLRKPETQPGTKVRLRGKGYDRGDGTFGDLIITYQVKLPTNLTERQKELLREMQRA